MHTILQEHDFERQEKSQSGGELYGPTMYESIVLGRNYSQLTHNMRDNRRVSEAFGPIFSPSQEYYINKGNEAIK